MPHPLRLDALVRDHHYGPYPDACILSTSFPSQGFIPSLKLMFMDTEDDAKPIGLDETEWLTSAPEDSRVARQDVRFYGILKVESLDWLSDQGMRWLEKDLRARDNEINMTHSVSGLTLKRLYGYTKGEGTRLSVIICCRKVLMARFLTSKDSHPTFLMQAADNNRKFEVLSMRADTYNRSTNFLQRWRLWALIEEIIATDKKKTPIEKRTIDWLIDEYLSRFIQRDRHRKILFDPHEQGGPVVGTTTGPRHVPHVPRNEIRGRIAEQAEWLLAHQLAPAHRTLHRVNIQQWVQFCKDLPKLRKEARQANHKYWGVPKGANRSHYEERDLVKRLCQFGETQGFWSKKLKNLKNKKAVPRELSPEMELPAEIYRPTAAQFHYDSDFSEASTIFPSGSDSDHDCVQELQSCIPSCCYQPPELPAGCFAWHCPGCGYEIDLLNISEENIAGLSDEGIAFLKSKSWKYLDEEPVRYWFSNMVSNHYVDHMKQNGVYPVERNGKWFIERWLPRGEIRRSTRHKTKTFKVEDP